MGNKSEQLRLAVIGIRGFPGVQGGVESHCEQLIPRIAQHVGKVRVYRRRSYLTQHSHGSGFDNVEFIDLPSTRIKGFEALFHTILCVLHLLTHRVDVVNIHNIGPGMMAPIIRCMGMKVVLTYHSPNYEHDKWGKAAKKLLRGCEKIALTWSNHIIFVSKFQRNKYGESIKLKSSAIANGINRHDDYAGIEFLQRHNIQPGKYVLGVGRLTPEKGFDTLISAIQKSDVSLVIAGGADHNPEYLKQLKALDINKRVTFTGYTTGNDLTALYSHAQAFILSSHNEGFPMVLLEAMSYGLPIVATDIAAAHIIELPAECYCQSGNVDSMAETISRVINSYNHRVTYDLAQYDWDNIASQTLNIYTTL